jgi:predicted aspartyl protease
MAGVMDILMILLIVGGGYWLMKTGELEKLLTGAGLPGLPPPFGTGAKPEKPLQLIQPTPVPTPQETAPTRTTPQAPASAPSGPTSGRQGAVTGKSIYQVVGNIATAGTGVTIRGGGNSFRDNLGYPCNKCARESTWIFKPGTAGDWSPKLGSHGDEGGKETLIELANIQMNGTGGKWQCEGPHMTYQGVSGGTGSAPRIGGKPRVGIKAVTWPLGQNRIHHELWYDATGSGNNWQKFAEFNGAATGCNAITCPVPGSKCQDTMRLDNPSGHQFIARSIVEIKPGAGAVGGGGAAGGGGEIAPGSGGAQAPAPTTGGGSDDRAGEIQTGAVIMAPSRTRRRYSNNVVMAPATTTTIPTATPSSTNLEPGAIPITGTERDMVILAKLNSHATPFEMVLDTGTIESSISRVNADQAGISKLKSLGTRQLSSGGTTIPVTRYNVLMQIGTTPAFQTTISVTDVDVGRNLLSKADLVKSGYTPVLAQGNMRLVKRGTSIIAPALIPSKVHHGLETNILINSTPLKIVYDTGVSTTILSGTDAAAVKIDTSKPVETVKIRSGTGGVRSDPVFMVSMKIGNTPAFQTRVIVTQNRPVSTLAGSDVIKSGHTAILSATTPQLAPRGTRIVAPVTTSTSSRPRPTRIVILQQTGSYNYVPIKINGHTVQALYDTGVPGDLHMPQSIANSIGLTGPPDRILNQKVGTVGYDVTVQIGDAPSIAAKVVTGNVTSALGQSYNYVLLGARPIVDSGYVPVLTQGSPRLIPVGTPIVAAVEVPLSPATSAPRHVPTLPVKINGKTITMYYDTGASHTILKQEDAIRLGISFSASAGGILKATIRTVTMQIGDTPPFQTKIAISPRVVNSISTADAQRAGYTPVWSGNRPRLVPHGSSIIAPVLLGTGGYECFDQAEDEIALNCCRFKAKPAEEPHCKTTLEAGPEYLKCCRVDKKAWGGLF